VPTNTQKECIRLIHGQRRDKILAPRIDWRELQRASSTLGVKRDPYGVRGPEDFAIGLAKWHTAVGHVTPAQKEKGSRMVTIVAIYRGTTLADLEILAVSSDEDVVTQTLAAVAWVRSGKAVTGDRPSDPALDALRAGLDRAVDLAHVDAAGKSRRRAGSPGARR
jgi:hypothetical protein